VKIVLAGATGFLGTVLVQKLAARGDSVTILSRRATSRPGQFASEVRFAQWDGKNQGAWGTALSGADAVINLSGESIAGGWWTPQRKRRILESRVQPTRALVNALRSIPFAPAILINASATGYYGSTGSGQVTESDAPGAGFLADTCRQWEAEALAATDVGTRVVLPRFGVVLGPGGGVLQKMVLPFRFFAGGPLGSGRQWISWVHIDDVCGAVVYALDQRELAGPVNVVAPQPVTMDVFSGELGRALGRPSWLRAPGWALRAVLGEMSELVLEGRQIVPRRLLESQYPFAYRDLSAALRSLVS
jgi:hypothetical protein